MYNAEHGFCPVELDDGRTACGAVARGGCLLACKFIVTVIMQGEKGLDQTRQ